MSSQSFARILIDHYKEEKLVHRIHILLYHLSQVRRIKASIIEGGRSLLSKAISYVVSRIRMGSKVPV